MTALRADALLPRMQSQVSTIHGFTGRRLALWLALAAVVLRAAIPAGWMPGSLSGGTPLVLCTVEGLTTITVGADGTPVPADDGASHADAPCLFAFAPSLFTPPDAAVLPPPSVATHAAAPAARAFLPGLSAAPPRARAPPHLS